jgi:VWFA-related protein
MAGFELHTESKYDTKVLVLLSDLMDAGSKAKFNQIKDLAKRSNVIIYSIVPDIIDSGSSIYREAVYRAYEMASITGGRTFFYHNREYLDFGVDMVVLSIKQLYFIGFEPSPGDNKWHDVKVNVKTGKREFDKSLFVFARKGYYSVSE